MRMALTEGFSTAIKIWVAIEIAWRGLLKSLKFLCSVVLKYKQLLLVAGMKMNKYCRQDCHPK